MLNFGLSAVRSSRPVARIDLEGAKLQNGDLLDPKGGLFEPHPPLPFLQTPHFFVHFVANSEPFDWCITPLAMGLHSSSLNR